MRFRRGAARAAKPTSDSAQWVEMARCALGEVESTAADMLRPHARRELGPAVHRKLVNDGISSLRSLIESAGAVLAR